ncbi:hypothetical protein [Agromyces flavus]|uniref:hypothetical protein n=1 Tax=Agromyces flavus TaxID=589382 RepID=UPI0036076794
MQTIFVRPVRDQFRAIEALSEELAPDAILIEGAFAGVVPLLLDDPASRPPIVGVGVIPLVQLSVDTAPGGLGLAPRSDALGRLRNRVLNAFVTKVVFRKTQALAQQIVRDLGRPASMPSCSTSRACATGTCSCRRPSSSTPAATSARMSDSRAPCCPARPRRPSCPSGGTNSTATAPSCT